MLIIMRRTRLARAAFGLLLALAAILLSTGFALAAEDDGLTELIDQSGIGAATDSLSPSTRELMRELGMDELSLSAVLALSPKSFLRLMARLAVDRLARPAKGAAALCSVTLLCAAAESLKLRPDDKTLAGVAGVVGSLCCCAAVAVPAWTLIGSVCSALGECAEFLLSFIPVYAGVLAAGGQPAAAAAYNAALFGVAEVSGQLAADTVKPLAGIFLALALVGAVAPSFGLAGIAGGVKRAVNWALGIISTVFVGVLGLQGTVGTVADSVTMKTARFAVSSAVPVVGGALADAMSSAAGYIGLLRSVVGAIGIAAGAAIFMPVTVELVLWRLGMGVVSLFAGAAGVEGISKAADAAGDVFEMLLALMLSMLLIVIVTTGIMAAVGNAR